MPTFIEWIRKSLTILVAAIFFSLTLLPALQIVLRLIKRPFIGAEELTRFFLISLVFLSYPLVVAAGENIIMGEFKAMLPRLPRLALNALIALLSAVLSLFVAYSAGDTMLKNLKNATPTLAIPFWLFLGSTLLAYLLAGVVHVHEFKKMLFPAGGAGMERTE